MASCLQHRLPFRLSKSHKISSSHSHYLYMTPDNPVANLRYETSRHAMLLREFYSAKLASQDVSDNVVGEFGVTVSFTTRQHLRVPARMVVIARRTTLRIAAFTYKAHGYGMSRICAWRRPLKILKPVISFDAVD